VLERAARVEARFGDLDFSGRYRVVTLTRLAQLALDEDDGIAARVFLDATLRDRDVHRLETNPVKPFEESRRLFVWAEVERRSGNHDVAEDLLASAEEIYPDFFRGTHPDSFVWRAELMRQRALAWFDAARPEDANRALDAAWEAIAGLEALDPLDVRAELAWARMVTTPRCR
jgi:hypothetical protein